MKNQKRWKDMLAGALIVTTVAALAVPALASTSNRSVQATTASSTSAAPAAAATQSSSYIGEAKAKEIALNHAGLTSSQVTFAWAKLDWDNGRAEYEVEFYANGKEYDYDIDAVTGDIRSYDYEAEHYTPSASSSAATQSSSYIGEVKAKEVALNHAGLTSSAVTFVRANLDWDDGRAEYEVEFYADGKEYDYDIDAVTGDIRSYDYDAEYYAPASSTASSGSISESQAKQIVQERAGSTGGTFREFKLDWDDGRSMYEGEYRVGWTEYEFEIDAATGTVLEWGVD
ncbi:PepSY domain-containing protein [Intestinimonas butyriciproducens]|uniref:PepSY domain-containing protein n=1 Tax=Intestinimonas butyriciproducens TaxID=1297617 RepID=UPI00195E1819|nr:PepSY domain-containing protein [Intestinimonas butyriciproducens]MBM6976114.1 PepSY domain-containing protein [Intestinimonas butyriciproducens]